MDNMVAVAKERLARREAAIGPVADPQAWRRAVIRGLQEEEIAQPRSVTASAQSVMIALNEQRRRPLPPAADEAARARGRREFAGMRELLGRP